MPPSTLCMKRLSLHETNCLKRVSVVTIARFSTARPLSEKPSDGDEVKKNFQSLVDDIFASQRFKSQIKPSQKHQMYSQFLDGLVETRHSTIGNIGKLCAIFRKQDFAEKKILDILYAHISRSAGKMNCVDVYQTLRFMMESGVCKVDPFVRTKQRLMQVYKHMDSTALSCSIKAIASFDKSNVDGNITVLFARFLKIWRVRRAKVCELLNISSAARECSYRDKALANRILNETLFLHGRKELSMHDISHIHTALQGIGYHSQQLENAMLASSMRTKGIIVFG
uniref:Uncharacterized protein n=1 Tax=Paramoeba aestuarina TaxID=180227 RepID=A0A7S4UJQ7_9EUKA